MKADDAPPQKIFVKRADMKINTASKGIGRMRRLKPLSPGAKIEIISPASWLENEKLVSAQEVLRASGFRVEISEQSFLRNGSFAGSDEARAQAINGAFADPDVSAIICARGGYGCLRAYNYLDFDLIRANPKIFVGYSDIAPLLNYIPQALEFPTFHGPMAIDISGDHKEQTADTLMGVLSGIERTICNYKPLTDDVIREGECFGALYGGNITMLSTSGGTAMF
jgi:muramoyltetrapeptide carboxypeptidase